MAGEASAGAVGPARVFRPTTEAEVGEALAAAASAGESVLVRGGGTRLEDFPSAAPSPAAVVIETRGLSGVIEHHRDDLTVEAWAGTTVAELREEIGARGQMLPLDPPFPDRATLGGVIAAAEPGIRRVPGARPRDLLLGLTVALADGACVRSGGRVVKNVTGYDLPKLFTGSRGTLGCLTRVALRLRAVPEAERTWVFPLPVEDSIEEFSRRVFAGLDAAGEPEAAALVPPGTGLPGLPEDGGFRLALRYEGLAEEADFPVGPIAAALGSPAEELAAPAAAALWAGVRDFLPAVPRRRRSRPGGGAEWGLSARGGRAAALRLAWRWAEFGPALAFPAQGRAAASVPGDALEAALAAAEPGLVAMIESVPPSGAGESVPPSGPGASAPLSETGAPPPTAATRNGAGNGAGGGPVFFFPEPPAGARRIMQRLREALDPEGRFDPGPFRWLADPA